MKHPEELDSRRKEIIEALNKTAKPLLRRPGLHDLP